MSVTTSDPDDAIAGHVDDSVRTISGYILNREGARVGIYDGEAEARLFSVPASMLPADATEERTLNALVQIYGKGRSRGEAEGRLKLQRELRSLLGAAMAGGGA